MPLSADYVSARRLGGCFHRIFHRNEEIIREKIRVEMAKRRSVAQLFGRDPAICLAPFPTSDGTTLYPFLQIRRGHRIRVNARILAEKTCESFKTPPFQIAIGIYERSDQKRKARDKSQGCFCVAVHQPSHSVELPFPEKKHITAALEKCFNPTEQGGNIWIRRRGAKRSRREAEDANWRIDGLSQLL